MTSALSIAERRYHHRMQASTARSLSLQSDAVKDAFHTEERKKQISTDADCLGMSAILQRSCWSPDTMSSALTSRRGSSDENALSDTATSGISGLAYVDLPTGEEYGWDTLPDSPTRTPDTERLYDVSSSTVDTSMDDELITSMETLLGIETVSREPFSQAAAERMSIAMPLTTQALSFHRQRMASDSASVVRKTQNVFEVSSASPTHRVVVKSGVHETIYADAYARDKSPRRVRQGGSEAAASYFPPYEAGQSQKTRRRRAVTSTEQNHQEAYQKLTGSSMDESPKKPTSSRGKRYREMSVEQQGTDAPLLIEAYDIIKPERKRLSFLRATRLPALMVPTRSPAMAGRSPRQGTWQSPVLKQHPEHAETQFTDLRKGLAAAWPEQYAVRSPRSRYPSRADTLVSPRIPEQSCGNCACCRAKSPVMASREATPIPPLPPVNVEGRPDSRSRARDDLEPIHKLMEQLFLPE